MDIPFRMFTSEVVALAKVSANTLRERRKEGTFPAPIDRGKEDIYSGIEVYKALGMLEQTKKSAEERLLRALS